MDAPFPMISASLNSMVPFILLHDIGNSSRKAPENTPPFVAFPGTTAARRRRWPRPDPARAAQVRPQYGYFSFYFEDIMLV